MNLLVSAPPWLAIVLCVVLVAAAVEDFVRLRISNIFVVAVLLSAIVAVTLHGWTTDLWQNLVVCLALLVGGTLLFASGKIGGGDVKLFAAIGLWVDLRNALPLVSAIFIAGGLLALVLLSRRFILRPANGTGGLSKSKGVPYGVAIAVGTLFILGLDTRAQLNQREQLTSLSRLTGHPGS